MRSSRCRPTTMRSRKGILMKTEHSTLLCTPHTFVPLWLSMFLVACTPNPPGEADPIVSKSSAMLNPGNGGGTGGGGGGPTCYLDLDGDQHGYALTNHTDCSDPGFSTDHNDCDDGNAQRWQWLDCYTDADRDGSGVGNKQSVCAGRDCASVGMASVKGDCDDGDSSVAGPSIDCYDDDDGDHYGAGHVLATCATSCLAAGRAESAGDCNDSDPNIHPHQIELANGVDDDCDGMPD